MASTLLVRLLAVMTVGIAVIRAQSTDPYKESRLGGCTLESKSISDCNFVAWGVAAVGWSLPGIIVGVIMQFCACPCYCICKYLCNCCGGRNQTPDCCFPNNATPARYSKFDIIRTKVSVVVVAALILGAFIWGYTGAGMTVSGLKGFGAGASQVPIALNTRLDAMDQMMTVRMYQASNKSTVTNRMFAGSPAYAFGKDIVKTMDDALASRLDQFYASVESSFTGFFLLFAFPLALAIVIVVSAFLNIRRFVVMLSVFLLFIFGSLVWIGYGVFGLLQFGLGDICTEIAATTRQQANVITALMSCSDSMFTSFRTSFKAIESDMAANTCSAMKAVCFSSLVAMSTSISTSAIFQCPPQINAYCNNATYASLKTWIPNVAIHPLVVADPTALIAGAGCNTAADRSTCTLLKCSTDCTLTGALSDAGGNALQTWLAYDATRVAAATGDTLGATYSTCESLLAIIFSPFDSSCSTLVTGLEGMRGAAGLDGIAVVLLIFAGAWGSKRFLPMDQADQPMDV